MVTIDEFSIWIVLVSVRVYKVVEFAASCRMIPPSIIDGTETVSEKERNNWELFKFKLNPSSSGRTSSGVTNAAGRAISCVTASTKLSFMSCTPLERIVRKVSFSSFPKSSNLLISFRSAVSNGT